MATPIVIIHGWSDDSDSFIDLANFLKQNLNTTPIIIRLADWLSMHDDVTFSDIAQAMQKAWLSSGLTTTPFSVNIVTHSTGALVARHWMTEYYTAETVPIKRHLMLAPANFGSHLAHKGHTYIGRVTKGWKQPRFQTGKKILKGLELASPYTFNLADRDIFNAKRWYGANRILATILIGNSGYPLLEGGFITNESGSDGVVKSSTANLNAAKVNLVLDKDQKVKEYNFTRTNGAIAFGILDNEDHSTIALKGKVKKKKESEELLKKNLILKSLLIEDTEYSDTGNDFKWQHDISKVDASRTPSIEKFQNLVTYVKDDLGHEVNDYFLEFYRTGKKDLEFDRDIYKKFIVDVHPYKDNEAYRAFYLDIKHLETTVLTEPIDRLFISITASPLFRPHSTRLFESAKPVGYIALDATKTGGLKLSNEEIFNFFNPHETLLTSLTIERVVSDEIFKIKNQ